MKHRLLLLQLALLLCLCACGAQTSDSEPASAPQEEAPFAAEKTSALQSSADELFGRVQEISNDYYYICEDGLLDDIVIAVHNEYEQYMNH